MSDNNKNYLDNPCLAGRHHPKDYYAPPDLCCWHSSHTDARRRRRRANTLITSAHVCMRALRARLTPGSLGKDLQS